VSLDETRGVLSSGDPATQASRLAANRACIEARTDRFQRVLHHVCQVV